MMHSSRQGASTDLCNPATCACGWLQTQGCQEWDSLSRRIFPGRWSNARAQLSVQWSLATAVRAVRADLLQEGGMHDVICHMLRGDTSMNRGKLTERKKTMIVPDCQVILIVLIDCL